MCSSFLGDLEDRAFPVLAESPAGPFLVMHPLDVLQGRLENVYGLSAKQDEQGDHVLATSPRF
jgi:hypothetical protein